MLNRNGKQFFRAYNISQSESQYIQVKTIAGDLVTNNMYWANCGFGGMIVGSGTAQPTPNDFCLVNQINTLTKVSETYNWGQSYDSNYMGNFIATFKNNTENPITVNELAITFYNTYTYDQNTFIICREVLDSPVVIQPQKSYSFSIMIG